MSSCGTPYSAPARIYASTHEKRHRDDQEGQAQNYACMLHNLMVTIQEHLLFSDDDKRGVLKSVELVGSTAQVREDNRICIWLEDV